MKSIKKNILLVSIATLILSVTAISQVLPAKIKKYLDDNYSSAESGAWKKAPGNCGGSKWLLTGDFNGDGRSDHLVRLINGKGAEQQLHLVAFINEKGGYTPDAFYDETYSGDVTRSASSIIKKGTSVSIGSGEEGNGPKKVLETDAITQFVCETDASMTYVFSGGEFRTLESMSLLNKPAVIPGTTSTPKPATTPTPLPTPTPEAKLVDIIPAEKEKPPHFLGTFTIYKADGSVDTFTGTVTFEKGIINFKISDGRSFTKATAFITNGLITTGWGRTATASDDGKTILWSDKTKWIKK